jgi:hypothetical protein
MDNIRPPVVSLYANYRELEEVRSEILALGNRYFWGSEGTLENVHAVVRCIEQANLIAFYQWRLLSITEYIRPDRLEDFFSLRVSGLQKAVDESKALITFIRIYGSAIEDERIVAEIEKGETLIKEDVALYGQLVEAISPHARPSSPFGYGGRPI